jgi:accessory gene regulator B
MRGHFLQQILFLEQIKLYFGLGGVIMIEKVANSLVNQMADESVIDKGMAEHYAYVLISWMEKFIIIGTVVLISIVANAFFPTLFFLIFFMELRKRTGGCHLDKFYQCYFASVVSYLIILPLSIKVANYPKLIFGMLSLAIVVIGIIGTVNHPNMHMNVEELAESKKAARTIVLLEGSIICCCALLGANLIYISYMAIAVILCATLLCIAKILKQEVSEYEEG